MIPRNQIQTPRFILALYRTTSTQYSLDSLDAFDAYISRGDAHTRATEASRYLEWTHRYRLVPPFPQVTCLPSTQRSVSYEFNTYHTSSFPSIYHIIQATSVDTSYLDNHARADAVMIVISWRPPNLATV